jgi:Zn-dependent alcohol dehydrogenase
MARHKKRFNWHRLISRFYPLEDVAAAIEDVEAVQVFKAVIAPGG